MAPDPSRDEDNFPEKCGLLVFLVLLILGGLGMWFMPSPSDLAARHAPPIEARL
jgi:hypothetical protein